MVGIQLAHLKSVSHRRGPSCDSSHSVQRHTSARFALLNLHIHCGHRSCVLNPLQFGTERDRWTIHVGHDFQSLRVSLLSLVLWLELHRLNCIRCRFRCGGSLHSMHASLTNCWRGLLRCLQRPPCRLWAWSPDQKPPVRDFHRRPSSAWHLTTSFTKQNKTETKPN